MKNNILPSIFNFLDYRKYLEEAFQSIKEANPKYSYRNFSRDAGYGSPNFLQQVISGSRKLNLMALEGTIRALKLNKKESEYLRYLVRFDGARSFKEREEYYQNILKMRSQEAVKPIEHKQFQYFSEWYHPVVRELVVLEELQGDAKLIADNIEPNVTEAQVEKSISLLQELGLIGKDPDTGNWKQMETIISTSSDVSSIALRAFHKKMIGLSAESIERFTSKERDVRGITLGLSEDGYAMAKSKIKALWDEIISLAEKDKNIKKVFQINFQLFPVSKSRGDVNDK